MNILPDLGPSIRKDGGGGIVCGTESALSTTGGVGSPGAGGVGEPGTVSDPKSTTIDLEPDMITSARPCGVAGCTVALFVESAGCALPMSQ